MASQLKPTGPFDDVEEAYDSLLTNEETRPIVKVFSQMQAAASPLEADLMSDVIVDRCQLRKQHPTAFSEFKPHPTDFTSALCWFLKVYPIWLDKYKAAGYACLFAKVNRGQRSAIITIEDMLNGIDKFRREYLIPREACSGCDGVAPRGDTHPFVAKSLTAVLPALMRVIDMERAFIMGRNLRAVPTVFRMCIDVLLEMDRQLFARTLSVFQDLFAAKFFFIARQKIQDGKDLVKINNKNGIYAQSASMFVKNNGMYFLITRLSHIKEEGRWLREREDDWQTWVDSLRTQADLETRYLAYYGDCDLFRATDKMVESLDEGTTSAAAAREFFNDDFLAATFFSVD